MEMVTADRRLGDPTPAPVPVPVPVPVPAPAPMPMAAAAGGMSRHNDHWYLQVLDLDLAWAHGVLGLGDWYLAMFGLIYGLGIIAFSLFVMQVVVSNGPSAKSMSRNFMIFIHFELVLYIALVIVKLPLLCKIKQHFLTLMDEDCDVLRFMFFERALTRIILGSLCCWVFSSFAYLLAWGDAGIDDPTLGDEVQGQRFQQYRGSSAVLPQEVYANQPPTASMYALPQRVTSALGMQAQRGSFAQSGSFAVGEPVAVSSQYEPRWAGGAGARPTTSFAINSGVHAGSFAAGGTRSFDAGGGRYASPQYNMPRQSSSMQSSTSNVSHSVAERQMLIKPPIVIH